eukprot:1347877-Amorphochlora_amoeboformis.AAC.1
MICLLVGRRRREGKRARKVGQRGETEDRDSGGKILRLLPPSVANVCVGKGEDKEWGSEKGNSESSSPTFCSALGFEIFPSVAGKSPVISYHYSNAQLNNIGLLEFHQDGKRICLDTYPFSTSSLLF